MKPEYLLRNVIQREVLNPCFLTMRRLDGNSDGKAPSLRRILASSPLGYQTNLPPHAYSDDTPQRSNIRKTGHPLKRSGAVIGFKAGNRMQWFPPPPPSGFYGRSCGSTLTTTPPVNHPSSAELGMSPDQGFKFQREREYTGSSLHT